MSRRSLPFWMIVGVLAAVALLAGVFLGLAPDTVARTLTPEPSNSISITEPSVAPSPSRISPNSKFLGVALPGGLAGLPHFEKVTGTAPDLLEVFAGWNKPFPKAQVESAYKDNALLLVSWEPTGDFAGIVAGKYDAYIKTFAAASVGRRVMLDFAHEFNGNWYPWGTQNITPARFVAAWRHIHDLFIQAKATNVLWVWSPNVINPVPNVNIASYWPGGAYVDFAGMVAYWTGHLGEDSWSTLVMPTERKIRTLTQDPILITETGAQQGPQKATWVKDLIQGYRDDPNILGIVYFDFGFKQNKRGDWTLEDDPAAVAAWRDTLKSVM